MLALDELRELLQKNPKDTPDAALLAATKEAETAVERGRTEYPESGEFLATESDLLELLNQAPAALGSLERAFKLNPRQDWLALRLAKKYAQNGDVTRAIATLNQCLQVNTESKAAHLLLAQLLQQSGGPAATIISHFRNSFTTGDNNFESQFWYGRELFLAGKLDEADRIFDSLSERAPGGFRTEAKAPIVRADSSIKTFEGTVARKEEGYAFIKILDLGTDIFASRADSARFDWERIRSNSRIQCFVAFSRKGARATKITLSQKK
jgi:predicted Zn-dependent protease/cold shock CspA family protein